jgi:hypothetical protein
VSPANHEGNIDKLYKSGIAIPFFAERPLLFAVRVVKPPLQRLGEELASEAARRVFAWPILLRQQCKLAAIPVNQLKPWFKTFFGQGIDDAADNSRFLSSPHPLVKWVQLAVERVRYSHQFQTRQSDFSSKTLTLIRQWTMRCKPCRCEHSLL